MKRILLKNRKTLLAIGVFIALAGCFTNQETEISSPPQRGADYFHPRLTDDFSIQLTVDETHPLVVSTGSQVMEVDLFDTDKQTIQNLKTQTKVLCYFSAGSYEDWRPDANQFPADIIGNNYDGWPGEKWLDIRASALKPILQARLDLAVEKGCDGVDPDNVNGYQNTTGFHLTAEDQLRFNRWLAQEAHQRHLFIALKNEGTQAHQLVNNFDAVVSEECYQYQSCGLFTDFIDQGKPVWDIEYLQSLHQSTQWTAFCAVMRAQRMHGYLLPSDLDGSFRYACE